jgi:AcrR family transcriptional regulator
MADHVKRRPYDGAGRRTRSTETRRRILDAARTLLIERGYRGTTIAAIAARAEVSVDTIYELVGRKPMLLRELIENALSGTDRAIEAEQRDHVTAVRAEPDPVRKLAIYARAVRETQSRLAPLFLAVRDAASTEPEATAIWHEISARRARNMRLFVRDVAAAGAMRDGVSIDDAADIVWVTNSSEVYVLFTVERGWSGERYERWLADTWRSAILP